jgi:hypothetical protein
MDGTSKLYIATTDIGWPNGLAIDFTCKKILLAPQFMHDIVFAMGISCTNNSMGCEKFCRSRETLLDGWSKEPHRILRSEWRKQASSGDG